jgi:hypothetical protein
MQSESRSRNPLSRSRSSTGRTRQSKSVVKDTRLFVQIHRPDGALRLKVPVFHSFYSLSILSRCGVILAVRLGRQVREKDMRIICSWCRGEGRIGLVGEKAPLEDRRETHSICLEHEKAVRARWAVRRRSSDFSSVCAHDGVRRYASSIRRVVFSILQVCVGLKGVASKVRF